MLLLGKIRLEAFVNQHADARVPFTAWQLEAEAAEWACPEEVKARYADAVVQSDRVLFSVKEIYKLDVKAKFKEGVLFVERVWTTKVSRASRSTTRNATVRSKA